MNKLMIVGRTDSGIAALSSALAPLGFRPALPSRRENKHPEEITAAICKSFRVPDPSAPGSVDFQQLQPGPVWRELATDLILGNEVPGPWFWGDPRGIYLLDFWKLHDPQTLFVMVYHEPEGVLDFSSSGVPPDFASGSTEQRLDNWEAYNSTLLRFFLTNPDRCLLIHGRRALMDPVACARSIGERLAFDPECVGEPAEATGNPISGDRLGRNLVEQFIIDRFLEANSRYRRLYQELQVSATLPLDAASKVPTCEEALVDHFHRALKIHEQAEEYRQNDLAQEWFHNQLLEVQEALEDNFLDTQRLKWLLRQAENLNAAPHGAAERIKNQLSYRIGSAIVGSSRGIMGVLLMPVVIVIETCHFALVGLRRKKERLPPLKDYADFEAAERVRRQLSYRVGHTLLCNLKTPAGWLRLPSAIAGEIKDFKNSKKEDSSAAGATTALTEEQS